IVPSAISDPKNSSGILGTVLSELWRIVSHSPLLLAMVIVAGLGLAVSVFRFFRWLPVTSQPKDPMRRFQGDLRAHVMRRAGARCEHHGLVGARCRQTEHLHVDHIHPHSKGGGTTVRNGQALCSRHNKQKAAKIPYQWQVRRLQSRRRGYFPSGEPVEVVRRERAAKYGSSV
ncbi:MAG TPA: HNH endonuclease, partial [Rhodopila sp.]|nr:HNH endonuclease [Rhodopila sp.]